MAWQIIDDPAPIWLLNQVNILDPANGANPAQREANLGNLNQDQANHLCFAFAAVSMIKSLNPNLFPSVTAFNNAYLYIRNIGQNDIVGGNPYLTIYQTYNNIIDPFFNINVARRSIDFKQYPARKNELVQSLMGRPDRAALITGEHTYFHDGNIESIRHTFILKYYPITNRLRLYNVWGRITHEFVPNGEGNNQNLFGHKTDPLDSIPSSTNELYDSIKGMSYRLH